MRLTDAIQFKLFVVVATTSLLAPLALAQTAPVAAPPLVPVADEASSYSIGLSFGNQLHSSGLEHAVFFDALSRGLKEGLAGKVLSAEDRDRSVQLLRTGREAAATRNRQAAQDFLGKNASVSGITTTASGLQYQVFSTGDSKAAAPRMSDRVTVNYRGHLLDGTEFDNSDTHPQATKVGLNGVIKGWREALLLMKPGAKWRLFIPPELGYDTYSPPTIPPGSLLIFEIELLKVEPPPAISGSDNKEHLSGKGASDLKVPVAKKTPLAPGQ